MRSVKIFLLSTVLITTSLLQLKGENKVSALKENQKSEVQQKPEKLKIVLIRKGLELPPIFIEPASISNDKGSKPRNKVCASVETLPNKKPTDKLVVFK